jgi:hypothetical protein
MSHSEFIPIYLKSHEVPMTEGSILAIHYIDHVLLHGKVKIRHLGMGLIRPKVGVTVIIGVIRIEKWYLSLTWTFANYSGVQNFIAIHARTVLAVVNRTTSDYYITTANCSYFLQLLFIVSLG